MGDKKNIDRLFQEQFKNFEVSPNDAIWENIQSKLEEDRRRKKMIPLWMKLGSIAASLLLLIAISVTLFSADDIESENVDFSEEESSEITNGLNSKTKENSSEIIYNKRADNPTEHSNSNSFQNELLEKSVNVLENKRLKEPGAIGVNSFDSENVQVVNNIHSNKSGLINQASGIITDNDSKSIVKESLFNKSLNALSKVTVVKNSKSLRPENQLSILNNNDERREEEIKEIANDKVGFEKENTLVSSSNITDKEFKDGFESTGNDKLRNVANNNRVASKNNKNTNTVAGNVKELGFVENDPKNIDSKNKVASSESVFDKEEGNDEECLDEQEEHEKETIEEVVVELNLKKNESKEEKEGDFAFNNWRIAPNIAPVYYNTLSGGSPIDSELSANKKKGQLTMSYGLGIGYVVNKRLTIRSGLNKVELGYDTQDVAISSSPETSGGPRIKNINLAPGAVSLNIASSDSFSITQIPSSFSSLFNSSLNQRLGYLEVPLEFSYKVSDKKIIIDVIAGVSTLFLNKNEIYAETNGEAIFIGEANNLNKMSYSTNIGFGFNYKIAKSLNFNFEPMFKYQLNTFSNDSGGFRPYILGVYSGFSYKF